VGGKYLAIAGCDGTGLSVLTRPDTSFDVAPGTEVEIEGPLGGGFPSHDCDEAWIICGGTAIGVGMSLLNWRATRGLRTSMVAYSRSNVPLIGTSPAAKGLPWIDRISGWNTAAFGRPSTPLDPIVRNDISLAHVNLFVAGPKSLIDGVRESVEKFGISANNIKLNY
jgi:ferredoxin-NADP reductase